MGFVRKRFGGKARGLSAAAAAPAAFKVATAQKTQKRTEKKRGREGAAGEDGTGGADAGAKPDDDAGALSLQEPLDEDDEE
jgi:hypothetical protein